MFQAEALDTENDMARKLVATLWVTINIWDGVSERACLSIQFSGAATTCKSEW